MRVFSTGIRIAIIGFVFVIGVTLGTYKFGTVIANTFSNEPQATGFPKNENGQTYGSGLDATTPDSVPDLISAYGVDGNIGYVLSKDLNGEMPNTPEEALSKQRSIVPGSARQIPLYDVSGKKVIGVFNVKQNEVIEYQSISE